MWHGSVARRRKTAILVTGVWACELAVGVCYAMSCTAAAGRRSVRGTRRCPRRHPCGTAHCWELCKARCAGKVGVIPSTATRRPPDPRANWMDGVVHAREEPRRRRPECACRASFPRSSDARCQPTTTQRRRAIYAGPTRQRAVSALWGPSSRGRHVSAFASPTWTLGSGSPSAPALLQWERLPDRGTIQPATRGSSVVSRR